eukprot:227066_1
MGKKSKKGKTKKSKKRTGGKKGQKTSDVEPELSPTDKIKFLLADVQNVRDQLFIQHMRTTNSEAFVREFRARYHSLKDDFESERARALEVSAAMARQYKSMTDRMNAKLAEKEKENERLRRALESSETSFNATLRNKDAQINVKDDEIQEWKQKMDDMAHEFGLMMKQTLDKMSERILVSKDSSKEGDRESPAKFQMFYLGEDRQNEAEL